MTDDTQKPVRATQEDLAALIEDASKYARVGAVYAHYKNPTVAHAYQVVALAIDEADESVVVVYQALYGEQLTFTRKLTSWCDTVQTDAGEVPRFMPMES